MNNYDLVKHLSNDLTIKEIAKETGLHEKSISRKISELKQRCLCVTIHGLVAKYLRNKIID